jgi:hypothetical protein
MHNSPYRFVRPTIAVFRDAQGYKLRELAPGSIFYPTGANPDANRMIDGTCNGSPVLVFVRDLEERAQPENHIVNSPSVRQ